MLLFAERGLKNLKEMWFIIGFAMTLQVYSHSYESAQKQAAENLQNTLDRIAMIG